MLPDKPEQVKDVSDRLWEAALDKANALWRDEPMLYRQKTADHARCLILLGEVEEPRDPLDEAIEAFWREWFGGDARPTDTFREMCNRHFGPFLKGEG